VNGEGETVLIGFRLPWKKEFKEGEDGKGEKGQKARLSWTMLAEPSGRFKTSN